VQPKEARVSCPFSLGGESESAFVDALVRLISVMKYAAYAEFPNSDDLQREWTKLYRDWERKEPS
jgi:hypothetical protein